MMNDDARSALNAVIPQTLFFGGGRVHYGIQGWRQDGTRIGTFFETPVGDEERRLYPCQHIHFQGLGMDHENEFVANSLRVGQTRAGGEGKIPLTLYHWEDGPIPIPISQVWHETTSYHLRMGLVNRSLGAVATCTADGEIAVWNVHSEEQGEAALTVTRVHDGGTSTPPYGCYAMAVAEEMRQIWLSSYDGARATILDVETLQPVRTWNWMPESPGAYTHDSLFDEVHWAVFASHYSLGVVDGWDTRSVRLDHPVLSLECNGTVPYSVMKISEHSLICGTNRGRILCWDLRQPEAPLYNLLPVMPDGSPSNLQRIETMKHVPGSTGLIGMALRGANGLALWSSKTKKVIWRVVSERSPEDILPEERIRHHQTYGIVMRQVESTALE